MQCRPDCSECCGHQVLVGLEEWSVALAWIHAHLPAGQQRAVVARAESLLREAHSALPGWLALKGIDPASPDYQDSINAALENLTTWCPFLVEGRCSIYPARPAICRGYGRMMRTEASAFYCDHILDQMRAASPKVEDITLPLFQPYHRSVLQGNGSGLDAVAVLPIWILAHRAPAGTLERTARRIEAGSPYPVVDGSWSFDDGA